MNTVLQYCTVTHRSVSTNTHGKYLSTYVYLINFGGSIRGDCVTWTFLWCHRHTFRFLEKPAVFKCGDTRARGQGEDYVMSSLWAAANHSRGAQWKQSAHGRVRGSMWTGGGVWREAANAHAHARARTHTRVPVVPPDTERPTDRALSSWPSSPKHNRNHGDGPRDGLRHRHVPERGTRMETSWTTDRNTVYQKQTLTHWWRLFTEQSVKTHLTRRDTETVSVCSLSWYEPFSWCWHVITDGLLGRNRFPGVDTYLLTHCS